MLTRGGKKGILDIDENKKDLEAESPPPVIPPAEDPGEGMTMKLSDLTVSGLLRPDPEIVKRLQESVRRCQEFTASEAAAREASGCPHTHLQEWHGDPEPLRC